MNALVSRVLRLRCVLPCPMCPISLSETGTHYGAQAGPESAIIFLHQSLLCWAYNRHHHTELCIISLNHSTPTLYMHSIVYDSVAVCICAMWVHEEARGWRQLSSSMLSTLFLRQILSLIWSSLIWPAGWPVNFPDLPASVLSTLEAAHMCYCAPLLHNCWESDRRSHLSSLQPFLTLNNFITLQPLHVASQMSHHWLQLHWHLGNRNAEHTFLFKPHYSYLHFGPAFSPTFKKFS